MICTEMRIKNNGALDIWRERNAAPERTNIAAQWSESRIYLLFVVSTKMQTASIKCFHA